MSLDFVKKRTSSNIFGKDLWGLGIRGYGLYNRMFNFDDFYDLEDKEKKAEWLKDAAEKENVDIESLDQYVIDTAWEEWKLMGQPQGPYFSTGDAGIMQIREAPLVEDVLMGYYRAPLSDVYGKKKGDSMFGRLGDAFDRLVRGGGNDEVQEEVEQKVEEKKTDPPNKEKEKEKEKSPSNSPSPTGSQLNSNSPSRHTTPRTSRSASRHTTPRTSRSPSPYQAKQEEKKDDKKTVVTNDTVSNEVDDIDKIAQNSGLGNISLNKVFTTLMHGASGDGLSETTTTIIKNRDDLDPTTRKKVETETTKTGTSDLIVPPEEPEPTGPNGQIQDDEEVERKKVEEQTNKKGNDESEEDQDDDVDFDELDEQGAAFQTLNNLKRNMENLYQKLKTKHLKKAIPLLSVISMLTNTYMNLSKNQYGKAMLNKMMGLDLKMKVDKTVKTTNQVAGFMMNPGDNIDEVLETIGNNTDAIYRVVAGQNYIRNIKNGSNIENVLENWDVEYAQASEVIKNMIKNPVSVEAGTSWYFFVKDSHLAGAAMEIGGHFVWFSQNVIAPTTTAYSTFKLLFGGNKPDAPKDLGKPDAPKDKPSLNTTETKDDDDDDDDDDGGGAPDPLAAGKKARKKIITDPEDFEDINALDLGLLDTGAGNATQTEAEQETFPVIDNNDQPEPEPEPEPESEPEDDIDLDNLDINDLNADHGNATVPVINRPPVYPRKPRARRIGLDKYILDNAGNVRGTERVHKHLDPKNTQVEVQDEVFELPVHQSDDKQERTNADEDDAKAEEISNDQRAAEEAQHQERRQAINELREADAEQEQLWSEWNEAQADNDYKKLGKLSQKIVSHNVNMFKKMKKNNVTEADGINLEFYDPDGTVREYGEQLAMDLDQIYNEVKDKVRTGDEKAKAVMDMQQKFHNSTTEAEVRDHGEGLIEAFIDMYEYAKDNNMMDKYNMDVDDTPERIRNDIEQEIEDAVDDMDDEYVDMDDEYDDDDDVIDDMENDPTLQKMQQEFDDLNLEYNKSTSVNTRKQLQQSMDEKLLEMKTFRESKQGADEAEQYTMQETESQQTEQPERDIGDVLDDMNNPENMFSSEPINTTLSTTVETLDSMSVQQLGSTLDLSLDTGNDEVSIDLPAKPSAKLATMQLLNSTINTISTLDDIPEILNMNSTVTETHKDDDHEDDQEPTVDPIQAGSRGSKLGNRDTYVEPDNYSAGSRRTNLGSRDTTVGMGSRDSKLVNRDPYEEPVGYGAGSRNTSLATRPQDSTALAKTSRSGALTTRSTRSVVPGRRVRLEKVQNSATDFLAQDVPRVAAGQQTFAQAHNQLITEKVQELNTQQQETTQELISDIVKLDPEQQDILIRYATMKQNMLRNPQTTQAEVKQLQKYADQLPPSVRSSLQDANDFFDKMNKESKNVPESDFEGDPNSWTDQIKNHARGFWEAISMFVNGNTHLLDFENEYYHPEPTFGEPKYHKKLRAHQLEKKIIDAQENIVSRLVHMKPEQLEQVKDYFGFLKMTQEQTHSSKLKRDYNLADPQEVMQKKQEWTQKMKDLGLYKSFLVTKPSDGTHTQLFNLTDTSSNSRMLARFRNRILEVAKGLVYVHQHSSIGRNLLNYRPTVEAEPEPEPEPEPDVDDVKVDVDEEPEFEPDVDPPPVPSRTMVPEEFFDQLKPRQAEKIKRRIAEQLQQDIAERMIQKKAQMQERVRQMTPEQKDVITDYMIAAHQIQHDESWLNKMDQFRSFIAKEVGLMLLREKVKTWVPGWPNGNQKVPDQKIERTIDLTQPTTNPFIRSYQESLLDALQENGKNKVTRKLPGMRNAHTLRHDFGSKSRQERIVTTGSSRSRRHKTGHNWGTGHSLK